MAEANMKPESTHWKLVAQKGLTLLLAVLFLGAAVFGEIGHWILPYSAEVHAQVGPGRANPKLGINRQNFEEIREGLTKWKVVHILGLPSESHVGRLKGSHNWFEWASWVGTDCKI